MIPLRNARRFFYKACRQPGYAFRVFLRRTAAFAGYLLRNGRSAYPEAITLFLTHRCNLRCRMCGQWGDSGVTKRRSGRYIREYLPFEELKEVIDGISSFRPNITLFGGEPLLHRDCVEIIRYIHKKNMHCLMITNGSLLEGVAAELVEAGLDELNVSLDGKGALHDEVRGMPGLYGKIINGLRRVRRFRERKNSRTPLINLQCTISGHNYRHLEQMTGAAREAGADSLTFHNLVFMAGDLMARQREIDRLLNCSSENWEGFVSDPCIDPDVLYATIEKIRKGRNGLPVDFYPDFSLDELRRYYREPSGGCSGRCMSPWMAAYIFPDGELRPCLNLDYSMGNVRKEGFSVLWNNDRAVKFRRILKKNGIFPVCIRCTELYRY
ncbi:MAG: radical SAM protein [Deferribacteres bacterium]|nr:radical SAM protein [Deferribacteres bacterium]